MADVVKRGQRPPFQPGNQLAVTHGGYSAIQIGKRAGEIADSLALTVPGFRDSDRAGLQLLAIALARVEALEAAISKRKRPPRGRDRLAEDQRRWIAQAARLLDQLGLTPSARSRIGADFATAAANMAAHQAMTERMQQPRPAERLLALFSAMQEAGLLPDVFLMPQLPTDPDPRETP